MRLIVFEGNTWNRYEDLRYKDKVLHKNLYNILKEMQRFDPSKGLGKPEAQSFRILVQKIISQRALNL